MSELRQLFSDPPANCSLGYFWILNSEISPDRLRSTVADLYDNGVKVVYPHPLPKNFRAYAGSTMTPDYLTEEYFDRYRVILDECRKRGMKVGLYDEGGWPSGGACGRVWAGDPEKFTRQYLVADGPGRVKIATEKIDPQRAPLPDVLHPDAVKKFIELTHEEYFRRFGGDFGSVIEFAFMDEPGYIHGTPERLPWCADFAEEFSKRKHYDIRPFLPEILALSLWPETVKARQDFYDVLAQLFTERFTLPLREWCRAHGIASGGHMDGEDEPARHMFQTYGEIMRSLRTLDLPGVDMIWRQLWPGERLHTYPKFASSAARQGGGTRALGEVFSIYGAGLTFADMRFLVSYLIVCGVNTLVVSNRPTSTEGQRMEGMRPFFGPINPLWRYSSAFHRMAARLCALSANSAPVVENALFYDTRSLWIHPRIAGYAGEKQEQIAKSLLARQCDFDYIDDDALTEALPAEDGVRIGRARYRRIIIPEGARMGEAARERLDFLRTSGVELVSSAAAHRLRPLLEFPEANPNFMLRTHERNNGSRLHFILNLARSPQEMCCALPCPGVIADIETGTFYPVAADAAGLWRRTFAPGELTVLITGADAKPNAEPPRRPGRVVTELRGDWTLRKLRRHSVGANDYVLENFAAAPAVPARLGDWAEFLGSDFSGEAEYGLDFDCSEVSGFIDLGAVKYVAAASLNGKELGVRIAPPYCFDVSAALRPGRNQLRVRVTNTLANAIASAEVWKNWRKLPFVSPYESASRWFERESLPSGLYGPVSIRTCDDADRSGK